MSNSKRILVAVDGTAESGRAVAYVADMVRGSPDVHIGLLHLVLPPSMLEWGGSDDPATEDRVSRERLKDYEELEQAAIAEGRTMLDRLKGILSKHGADVAELLVQFVEPLDLTHVGNHILRTAAERDYLTVVVARHSFAGLKRWFRHLGEELIRRANGLTICVVA
jgi:nucleotide-binding universal stress UspA family protein